MLEPTLFRDRSRAAQIVLGGVLPAITGAIVGVLVGVSAAGYWAVGAVAAIGGFLAGFEHQDGWGGADRGVVGGAIYGTSLLIAHEIAGTHAKVSLGSFPPLLAVVTAIIGMFLGAAGGRIARLQRERRAAASAPATPEGELDEPSSAGERPAREVAAGNPAEEQPAYPEEAR
jgi:hypothetical protein